MSESFIVIRELMEPGGIVISTATEHVLVSQVSTVTATPGPTIPRVAGEDVVKGNVLSLDADGTVHKALATVASGYERAFGVSEAAHLSGSLVAVRSLEGALYPVLFDTIPAAASNGSAVWLSATTAGVATLTPPASPGDAVNSLGILVGADGANPTPEVLWRPQFLGTIT